MMSVLALAAGLAVTSDAGAQQATRKATTHKGTAKRSLVKKSAPVQTEDGAAGGTKPLPPVESPDNTTPTSVASDGKPLPVPRAPAPKAPSAPATKSPTSPVVKAPVVPSAPVTKTGAAVGGATAAPTAGAASTSAGTTAPGSKQPPPPVVPTAPVVPEQPVVKAPPIVSDPNLPVAPDAGEVAAGLDAKGSASTTPSAPKPLAPKTSGVRRPTTAKTVGTSLATAPTGVSTSSAGANNRVTDPAPVARPKPVLTSSGSSTTSSGSGDSTVSSGGSESGTADSKPTGETTTTSATKPSGGTVQAGAGSEGDAVAGASGGTATTSTDGQGSKEAPVSSGDAGTVRPSDPIPVTYTVTAKPLPSDPRSARFRALAWSPVSLDGVDFVAPFVWAGLPGSPVASDPVVIAQQLLQRPEGQRVLCFWDVLFELADHPLDRIQTPDGKPTDVRSPFMDNGIEATAERVNALLAGIRRAGATVDVLVLDYERTFAWDPRFASLDNDPRWIGLARELGFEDLRGMDAPRIARWNEVMGRFFDDAIARSTDQPLQSIFPGARLANFESFASTPAAPVIGSDGLPFLRASVTDRNGTLLGLGSHDSSPFFGMLLPAAARQRVDGVNPIGEDGFAAARLEVHRSRAMRKPAGRAQMPWIAPRSFDAAAMLAQAEPGTAAPMRSTPYWDEMVFQLGLHGAEDFLYWNPEGSLAPQAPVASLPEDHQALDGVLETLNRTLGQQPGDSVYREQPGFDDRILATGRDDGESIVWRLTFDPGIESVKVFFTDGASHVVSREADRPGAWLAHPRSKSLVFDADNTAPAFEVVAARTSGTDVKAPDGTTESGGTDQGGSKESGGTTDSTASTGGSTTSSGSTEVDRTGGSGSDPTASSGSDGASAPGGTDAPAASARELLIAQLTAESRQRAVEAMGTIFTSRRTSDWTGGLSYRRDRWAAMLAQAAASGSLSSYLNEVNAQGASAVSLDPALYIRSLSLEEIHPQLLDARAASAGQNQLACALAYADVNQSALLQQRGVVLAIAAAQTGDPALIAKANDMLRAFAAHNPLQRPGTTLTSSSMVMPEGGDGVWLATAWGIDGIIGMMSALGDRVPADLQADLEVVLRREVRNICVDWADQRPWFVRVRAFNSNQWMEPAVALIKACLFLGDPALLPAYNLGVESLAASLAVHGVDGAYLEGFSYAAQSLGTVFDIVDDMRSIGDQRCSEFGFTSNNWRWLMHTVMPGGYVVNCYDSGRSILPDWGRAAPMPHFGIVAAGSEPDALLNMAWMFPQGRGDLPGLRYASSIAGLGAPASMTLPTHAYFPSQQVVTWRSEWERPSDSNRALGVWVRGGALLDGHAHRDQGQVSVYAGDRPILIDCGSDYSNPNQEAMLAAAAGHGIMQVGALSPRHKAISAPVVVSRLDEQAGSVLVDSTAAYFGVVSCVRTVQWDVSGRVTFGDTVAFREEVAAGTEVYRFHTASTLPLEISGSGRSWQVSWEGATMAISADRPIVVEQSEWPDAVLPGKLHRLIRIRSVDELDAMALTSVLEVSLR
jgi:hypothetical protein